MKSNGDTTCSWCSWYNHKRIGTETRGLGIKKSGDHPNYRIIKIGQDTEKSPGDWWKLAVTQPPLRNHRVKLVWKTQKIIVIIIIVKLKESEKRDKYLDLARYLKKQWSMKVTVIPIVIGELGIITKGLVQGLEDLEIRGQVETIQTTALLRSARILRRVRETCGDFLSLRLQWTTISKRWCEELSKE